MTDRRRIHRAAPRAALSTLTRRPRPVAVVAHQPERTEPSRPATLQSRMVDNAVYAGGRRIATPASAADPGVAIRRPPAYTALSTIRDGLAGGGAVTARSGGREVATGLGRGRRVRVERALRRRSVTTDSRGSLGWGRRRGPRALHPPGSAGSRACQRVRTSGL